MPLEPEEIERYSRHLILPDVGMVGQEKLKAASVLLVGAGGLGSPLAMYLAAAGVGRLGIVDFDVVDASNLHRQVIHGTSDVGRPKLESARDRIREINPHIEVVLYRTRLSSDNALDILKDYELVADGTDNFPTRYLVNDACVLSGTPNVYASIFRFEGQVSIFGTPDGPCYRCIFPEPPPPGLVPSCAEGGVLGVLPGMVGTMQATEVIKMILGIGEPMIGRLLFVDALSMKFREWKIHRDPDCPVCGDHPAQTTLIDYEAFCGVGVDEETVPEITAQAFSAKRARADAPFVLDVRKPSEVEIADLGADLLIPVDELAGRVDELDAYRERSMVVHCRSGVRSARAVSILLEAGFTNVVNLKGGILAWSEEIDPSIPRY